ncbi:MAG: CpXC domain-containing protein, partial [Pseudomonadota bacterium]
MGKKPDLNSVLHPYGGSPGQTGKKVIHQACACGRLFGVEIYHTVNLATDPDLGDLLRMGKLGCLVCPDCEKEFRPAEPLVVHDPNVPVLAILAPEDLRHKELELRVDLLSRLSADPADVPEYVKVVPVVYSVEQLTELIEFARRQDSQVTSAFFDKRREHELVVREEELLAQKEDLLGKEEDLIALRVALEKKEQAIARERLELERERSALRALSLDLTAREQALRGREEGVEISGGDTERGVGPTNVAGGVQKEVERWLASGEQTAHFMFDGRLLLTSHQSDLECFCAEEPVVLIQLHLFSDYPFTAIVAHPPGIPEKALCWPLDVTSADQSVLLHLADRFVFQLDLYDEESAHVSSWEIASPLEENVRMILERSEKNLIRPESLDFGAANQIFERMAIKDRLGRKQHNFSKSSFTELPSVGAVRLALSIVSYWSEPANEHYLLLVKSFPMKYWRDIRERVVKKAIEFGLRFGGTLVDLACELGLVPSIKELLTLSLANFAEVCLRLKPNDLDPLQEWENWKNLLADCVKFGVSVDSQVEKLAAASARRARETTSRIEDETEPGGDLSLLMDE